MPATTSGLSADSLAARRRRIWTSCVDSSATPADRAEHTRANVHWLASSGGPEGERSWPATLANVGRQRRRDDERARTCRTVGREGDAYVSTSSASRMTVSIVAVLASTFVARVASALFTSGSRNPRVRSARPAVSKTGDCAAADFPWRK